MDYDLVLILAYFYGLADFFGVSVIICVVFYSVLILQLKHEIV